MQRFGRKNRPFYRIAAVEKLVRRDGPVIENLGWYDPMAKDAAKQLSLNDDRVKHWLAAGAQPSDTVRDMLAKRSLVDVKEWERQREMDRKIVQANIAKKAAAAEKKEEKK
jgi:small subunit ribosomal protein S16